MSEGEYGPKHPVDEIKVGDREYQLLARKCDRCNNDHYEIWRWCGASFARWHMHLNFVPGDFQRYVEILDDQLLVSSNELLDDFHQEMDKINCSEGIAADWTYSFRLMEYARQRASLLNRLGFLDILLSEHPPQEPHEIAVRAAFELGHAAAERKLIADYEEYLFDGFAVSEWREAGLPKAREERIRQGERTRGEILKAAKLLYSKDPNLARNDTETARQILKMKLPGLQKGKGQQLSLDAITRHLREARKHPRAQEN